MYGTGILVKCSSKSKPENNSLSEICEKEIIKLLPVPQSVVESA